MAAKGYPEYSEKGAVIHGLDKVSTPVFHMGTKRVGDDIVINGGRVLLICAQGKSLQEVYKKVYNEIVKIDCEELFYRKDIGHLSL